MKVVLLAGGLGTRLSEETEYRPKPMVEIGGVPFSKRTRFKDSLPFKTGISYLDDVTDRVL